VLGAGVLVPVMLDHLVHLILQVEFQFLEPGFFDLLFVRNV
jgi:hypothetical protein